LTDGKGGQAHLDVLDLYHFNNKVFVLVMVGAYFNPFTTEVAKAKNSLKTPNFVL